MIDQRGVKRRHGPIGVKIFIVNDVFAFTLLRLSARDDCLMICFYSYLCITAVVLMIWAITVSAERMTKRPGARKGIRPDWPVRLG